MSVTALGRATTLSGQPAVARAQLARMLAAAGWPDDVDGILLAAHEAMINALRHAGGITRAIAGFEGDTLVVEVWDRGGGFSVPRFPAAPDARAERGRGLFLMTRLATEVQVKRTGADVGLVLRFDRPGGRARPGEA